MLAIRRRRVVVNLIDGRAITGERCWSWPWQVRLIRAELVARDAAPLAIDGTTLVPRHRIDFIQVVD